MTGYDFRFATGADATRVAALIERAYRGPMAATGWSSEAALLSGPRTSVGEIAGLIGNADGRFLLAEADGVLLGCVLIQRRGDTAAYFGMLSIEPGLQATGLGKQLLARCEATVRELWGSKAMTLVVINLREPLIAWYERRGYAKTGKHEPFPFSATTGEINRDFHLIEMRKEFWG